jgi:eukaryotic-like serine/threonine-protein kinase
MEGQFALAGFVVDELIGFGGTGEVWRAHDAASGETVALKRLRTRGAGATARLRREADVLAAVAGPHVLGVRSLVVEGDEAVLVLDYAPGGSLATVLGVRGRLPAPEVVTVLAPLAAALAAAHARGLVHGDLTPANILFTSDGRPLLADFGVAAAIGTRRDAVEGTVDYLDPAILEGAPPNPASDVFALGAIGFAALAGQPVWGIGTADQMAGRAALGLRAALDELAPDAPLPLLTAVESALASDPDDRPDARAFGYAVLRACAAAPVGLVVVSGPGPAPPPMTQLVAAVRGETGKPVQHGDDDAAGWDPDDTPWAELVQRIRGAVRRWGRWALPAVAVLAVAAVVFVLSVVRVHPGGGGSEAAQAAAGSPTVGARPTPASSDRPLSADPSTAAAWVSVVGGLETKRAQAFAAADPALLAEVYVPQAAGYRLDRSIIRSLRSRGLRARGFSATVERVRPERVTAGSARLRVTDRLGAYTLVDESGRVAGRGAARSERVFTLVLARSPNGWRVARIASA